MQTTWQSFGLFWLRLFMGAGIMSHGYAKVFGGGMDRFADGVARLGFPQPELFAWAAATSELVGGLMVALGAFTRAAAALVFATMCVAVFLRHASDPFKVKELALAYWTMSGSLIFTGAGSLSFDGLWARRKTLLR